MKKDGGLFYKINKEVVEGNGMNKKRAIKALHPQRKNTLLNLR